jgi:predicted nucleotide-binding protein
LVETARKIECAFEDAQAELLSLLTPITGEHERDTFLADLVNKIKNEKTFYYNDFVKLYRPKGQQMSRDMPAIQAGLEIPPHIAVLAEMESIKSPYTACANLSKYARRVASHLENLARKEIASERIGTNVFIGHGRSKAWKDLKDFVQDRLHLPYDEFNRVSVAGFTNIARLSQMLDSAAVAFIILTAEDEQADGTMHARMNVIHEAGLFQGRLGFERAILLLEEGCEEFSNIQGLGQIRFPTGDIAAKFEEIRRVLEREGLVE